MQNRIDARIECSFKGEHHVFSTTVDLDAALAAAGELPDLHVLLARVGGVDPHSYLFEVLQVQEVEFANASGLAAEFLHDGRFDAAGFAARWRQQREEELLGPIAARHMGVRDLKAHPALREALREAFDAGRASRD